VRLDSVHAVSSWIRTVAGVDLYLPGATQFSCNSVKFCASPDVHRIRQLSLLTGNWLYNSRRNYSWCIIVAGCCSQYSAWTAGYLRQFTNYTVLKVNRKRLRLIDVASKQNMHRPTDIQSGGKRYLAVMCIRSQYMVAIITADDSGDQKCLVTTMC
jgi:hypothetical protein